MRHERGMLDETLHPAQTLCQREQMAALQHPASVIQIPAQNRRDDATIPARHLSLRQRMLRMAFESRVVHPLDLRMFLQKLRNGERIRTVPLHTQRQRLDAAQRQKAVKRSRYGTDRIL